MPTASDPSPVFRLAPAGQRTRVDYLNRKSPRFRASSLNPLQQADRDEQANSQQQDAAALVTAIEQLRHHLLVAMPHYVYSDPISFGGITTAQNGAFRLDNEFGSPCQYRVLQVAFGGAGTAQIGATQGLLAPSATSVIDSSARLRAQTFAAAGEGTISGAEDAWTDLPASGSVYLAVSATTNAAWATVQFRRRVSPAGVYAEGHS